MLIEKNWVRKKINCAQHRPSTEAKQACEFLKRLTRDNFSFRSHSIQMKVYAISVKKKKCHF